MSRPIEAGRAAGGKPSRPGVVWLGDAARTEFRSCLQLVNSEAELFLASSIEAAAQRLELDEPLVELVILAQTYPGQFSLAAIDRLRHIAPLARLWGLLGAWCEGEVRSGSPWPGVPRVYWHQFPARFRQELRRRSTSQPPHWSLPITASDEDRLLLASHEELCSGDGVVAVVSSSFSTGQWLADACRGQGYRPLLCDGAWATGRWRGLRAAIWDGPLDADVGQLRALADAIYPAPVIALLGFPRPEHVTACLEAGAATVLSKPIPVDELFAELERAALAHEAPPTARHGVERNSLRSMPS